MFPLKDDQQTETFPFITILLIAVNVAVFIGWQIQIGVDESVKLAGYVPSEFMSRTPGAWKFIFMSMFMHGGWMHLIANMWFLWIFGNNIEDNCGSFRYLIFYVLCDFVSTVVYTVCNPHSEIPLVGASGAISGVLGAYLLHHPHARVLTLVPIFVIPWLVQIPAWIFLFVWMGFQIVSQLSLSYSHGAHHDGVAYVAHIGGFIAGMVLIHFFEKGNGPAPEWR